MPEPDVRTVTETRAATPTTRKAETLAAELALLLPGIPGDPVSFPVPPYSVTDDENGWQALLADPAPEMQARRRGLLEHVRALLELNAYAREQKLTLAAAARERAGTYRSALERAWATLLEQNRPQERAVRWAALAFSNMQTSRELFRDKIFAIDASAEEIASEAGREFLANELSHYVDRPDPRQSRAFLVVHDWVGTPTALKMLARVTDEHRCMLITDAPSYDSLDKLRTAATEGGLLEALPGEELHHRHTVLVANQGRVRRRFRGTQAEEREDVFVPLSGPWFGMYLDNVAQGRPWKPAVGYQNPIPGVDGVRLDLRLKARDHFDLYLRHRSNPAILLAPGSEQVVVYGPDTLSRAGNGVQIGVAVVEMICIRYSEWTVNRWGLLNDLEEAEQVVRRKLTQFLTLNSGADRMFRAGSRVHVSVDEENRSLNIEYDLRFRELAERAVIRVSKPVDKDKLGRVAAGPAAS